MSPENTHKLMGFYVDGLILGIHTLYRLFCFFKLFLIGCIYRVKILKIPLRERALYAPSLGSAALDELLVKQMACVLSRPSPHRDMTTRKAPVIRTY